jgi:type IV secretion system protein VirD4
MDTIVGNCDTMLFLGGKEKTTLEEISKMLGNETIDMYNTSVTKGNQESHGQNFQKLGKDLMSVDELAVLDGGKCILQLRGERPFLSRKYDITRHKNYHLLSDANPKNAFNIEKHLSTKLILKPDDKYDVIEIDLSDEPPEPLPAV